MFYLGVILLSLAAATFACWPLLRQRRAATHEQPQHDQIIRDLYRARTAELERETEDQGLRAEIFNELGAVLLTEDGGEPSATGREPSATKPLTRPRWLFTALIACLIPMGGTVVYWAIADPSAQQVKGAEAVLTLADDETAELQGWIFRLTERTSSAPDDSKSWYLLGHAHLKLAQYAPAAEAFATTQSLVGDDINVQVYWLQARYLAADGILDDVSRGLARSLLEKQPGMSVVLEILALDAYQQGKGEEAITLLNRAVTGSQDMRQQASFAVAIKQVRAALKEAPPGVSIDIAATGNVPQHASVFVIARPIGGGMPFAVVKRPAFLLPFAVRLDDLVSMSPTRKLSDAQEYEVLVRLSESGVAMAQTGDWQWQSSPLTPEIAAQQPLEAVLSPPNLPPADVLTGDS